MYLFSSSEILSKELNIGPFPGTVSQSALSLCALSLCAWLTDFSRFLKSRYLQINPETSSKKKKTPQNISRKILRYRDGLLLYLVVTWRTDCYLKDLLLPWLPVQAALPVEFSAVLPPPDESAPRPEVFSLFPHLWSAPVPFFSSRQLLSSFSPPQLAFPEQVSESNDMVYSLQSFSGSRLSWQVFLYNVVNKFLTL